MRPAVLQHEILPLLQGGWRAIPEERMLQHHQLVRRKQSLFAGKVDIEFRIDLVEVMKRNPSQVTHGVSQSSIDR